MTLGALLRKVSLEDFVELKGRRVLVVGLGRSGQAAARFLLARGARVTATDLRPAGELGPVAAALADAGVRLSCGGHDAGDFLAAELVVVSPGVPTALPALDAARREGIPVVAEVELASWFVRGHLLALTGSNGKSTTTSLLARMLAEEGRDAVACGNIGLPLLEALSGDNPDRWYAVELSSFQLEGTERFHPGSAALLNLQPDHLDRHGSLEGYLAAKARIFTHQGEEDVAVLNADDAAVAALARELRAEVYTFSLEGPVRRGAYLSGDRLMLRLGARPRRLMQRGELPLAGDHNVANVLAAAVLAATSGVSVEAIRRAVTSFRPLPHRLSTVATVGGITYVDDSKATNVDSAKVALTAFPGRKVYALLGGRAKGSGFESLVEPLERAGATAVVYGEAGPLIAEALAGRVEILPCADLPSAVREASGRAAPGDVVLLAPACASFDAYRNFHERGEDFARQVRALAGNGEAR